MTPLEQVIFWVAFTATVAVLVGRLSYASGYKNGWLQCVVDIHEAYQKAKGIKE